MVVTPNHERNGNQLFNHMSCDINQPYMASKPVSQRINKLISSTEVSAAPQHYENHMPLPSENMNPGSSLLNHSMENDKGNYNQYMTGSSALQKQRLSLASFNTSSTKQTNNAQVQMKPSMRIGMARMKPNNYHADTFAKQSQLLTRSSSSIPDSVRFSNNNHRHPTKLHSSNMSVRCGSYYD